MRLSELASKLQLSRLLGYGYKILGRINGLNQEIDEILIPEKLMANAIDTLDSSRLETTVFFFGKTKGKKLLATDILTPDDGDYEKRTFGHVRVSTEYVLREFPKLKEQGKTLLVTLHSHPMDTLSFGDANTHMSVTRHYPHQLSGVYNNGRLFFYRFEDGFKDTPHQTLDLSRFDRQIRAFGTEGQLLTSSATVALIGVGGGNTKLAFDLASMGIGKLILFDPDEWEEHNRNRIFIPPTFVGKLKAISVSDLIQEYYPDVEVNAWPEKIEYFDKFKPLLEEQLSDIGLMIVGPDNMAARIFCNRLALKLNKPAIFLGAKIESKQGNLTTMGGSVQTVIPNITPCYECITPISQLDIMRETLDPEIKKRLSEKYGLGDSLKIPTVPAIASLNNVVAGIALWEIVKLITGIEPCVNFQIYDSLKTEIKVIETVKNPQCPACGEQIETEPSNTEDAPSLVQADEVLSSINDRDKSMLLKESPSNGDKNKEG